MSMSGDQSDTPLAAIPAAAGHTWSFLPSFDGQTIVSIALGAVLTIVTFWIGYRKTIGAQDERARAATTELCSSVIKRVAVEREVMTAEQFAAIRQAKAYKAQVQIDKLVEFGSALDTALLETIDNNFLDSASKKSIIELIDKSRAGSVPRMVPAASARDKARERISAIVALGSAALGLFGSLLFSGLSEMTNVLEGDPTKADNYEAAAVGSLIVTIAIAVLLFLYVTTRKWRARSNVQKS